jgi:hypothetical protein
MKIMNNYRNNAKFAGVMFLLAMVSSLVGGMLIQSVIGKPDFMGGLLEHRWVIIVGVALELLNAFAVVGIAAAFWPALKLRYPALTAGYFGLRLIEAVVCTTVAFIPVVLLILAGSGGEAASAILLCAVRDTITAYAVPVFFGIGASLFYVMLYRSEMMPKYISAWGFIAAIGVMATMLIPLSAAAVTPILGLPIIVNEIYLGIYLIAKGLSTSKECEAL